MDGSLKRYIFLTIRNLPLYFDQEQLPTNKWTVVYIFLILV